MQDIFARYAAYYDIIYQDKDYLKECSFFEKILRRYSAGRPVKILELACGTGGHAIPLAKKGYRIAACDMSAGMVALAKEKARARGVNISFKASKMQDFRGGKAFDAAVIFFASINYLRQASDIKKTFLNVRSQLKKGGIFTFDFWNGFAVMANLTPGGVKVVHSPKYTIHRESLKKLFPMRQLCEVRFKFKVSGASKFKEEFSEKHLIRYFFPEEIKSYLEMCGFEALKICPFLRLDSKLTAKDWDATIIARKN